MKVAEAERQAGIKKENTPFNKIMELLPKVKDKQELNDLLVRIQAKLKEL
jgi:hypothetical protein